MFIFIHALLGGLIAMNISSLILIAILAIVSHYVLDWIPHWDGPFNKAHFKKTGVAIINRGDVLIHALDVLLVIAVIIIFHQEFDSGTIIFGALVSILPDFMKIGYITRLKTNDKFMKQLKFHAKIQKDVSWKLGLLTQVLILAIILILIF
jgi:hypothetical protein